MLHKIARWLNLLYVDTSKVFTPTNLKIVTFGTVCHMGYAYGSKSSDEVEVASKYQIWGTKGVGTHFVINTTDGRQFLIPSSLWYWQFDVAERWNAMIVGKKYKVDVYGYRVPALGTYPNIIGYSDKV